MRHQKGFTPLLIILLIAAVIGVYLLYSGKISLPQKQTPSVSASPSPVVESMADSISRCGKIPDKAYPTYGHFDVRNGPLWSPDCTKIAWSMWESGTGCPDCPPAKLTGNEGVFIYDNQSKTINKIYDPKQINESPEFIRWEDNDNLIFKADGKEYGYNLKTKEASLKGNVDGRFCGGIAANLPENQCPTGYKCLLDGNYPDAGGKCVKR